MAEYLSKKMMQQRRITRAQAAYIIDTYRTKYYGPGAPALKGQRLQQALAEKESLDKKYPGLFSGGGGQRDVSQTNAAKAAANQQASKTAVNPVIHTTAAATAGGRAKRGLRDAIPVPGETQEEYDERQAIIERRRESDAVPPGEKKAQIKVWVEGRYEGSKGKSIFLDVTEQQIANLENQGFTVSRAADTDKYPGQSVSDPSKRVIGDWSSMIYDPERQTLHQNLWGGNPNNKSLQYLAKVIKTDFPASEGTPFDMGLRGKAANVSSELGKTSPSSMPTSLPTGKSAAFRAAIAAINKKFNTRIDVVGEHNRSWPGYTKPGDPIWPGFLDPSVPNVPAKSSTSSVPEGTYPVGATQHFKPNRGWTEQQKNKKWREYSAVLDAEKQKPVYRRVKDFDPLQAPHPSVQVFQREDLTPRMGIGSMQYDSTIPPAAAVHDPSDVFVKPSEQYLYQSR